MRSYASLVTRRRCLVVVGERRPLLQLPTSSVCLRLSAVSGFHSSSFVCRNWTALSRRRVIRQGSDNDNEKQQKCSSAVKRRRRAAIVGQLRSLPNVITAGRIVFTPLLSYFVVTHQYGLALSGCALAAFTDWLDGHIAKTYRKSTVLGTYLDPLADKFLINTLSCSLCYNAMLPLPIVSLWLLRDLILVTSTCHTLFHVTDPATTPLKVRPTFISKLNTALQFATLAAGMLQPLLIDDHTHTPLLPFIGENHQTPHNLVLSLCWITAGTTVASALSYLGGTAFRASGNPKSVAKSLVATHRRRRGKQQSRWMASRLHHPWKRR